MFTNKFKFDSCFTVHTFGTCLNHQTGNFEEAHYMAKSCSVKLPEYGAVHHYLGMFYGKSQDFQPPYIRDEYSLLMESLNGSVAVEVTSLVGDPHSSKKFMFNRINGYPLVPP
jgi:hypothetical protein